MPDATWPVHTPVPVMFARVSARAAERRRHRLVRRTVLAGSSAVVVALLFVNMLSTSPTSSELRTTPADGTRAADASDDPADAAAVARGHAAAGSSVPGPDVPRPGSPGGAVPVPGTTVPPFPGATTTTTRPLSPGSGDVAFVRNTRIWLMGNDGSTLGPLTDEAHQLDGADWSPDGSSLVAVEWRTDATGMVVGHLVRVTLDGKVQPFTADAGYSTPKWAPDGSRIAFRRRVSVAWTAPEYELWTVKADGTDERRVAGRVGVSYSWSPDAKRLAYECDGGLCTVAVDGTDVKPVSGTSNHRDPAWSPDGQRLAANVTDGAHWRVVTVKLDGTERRVAAEGLYTHGIDWSPDGRTLLFSAAPESQAGRPPCVHDCPGEGNRIWRVGVDGSGRRALTGGPSDFAPSWKPGR